MSNLIDTKDLQGMLLRGYGSLRANYFTLLKIEDATKAKAWLQELSRMVSHGQESPSNAAINVAVTCNGLRALGMKEKNIRNFIREFREGMITPHRQRILADVEASAPENWRWGGPEGPSSEYQIHILLLVFGKNQDVLNQFYNELAEKFSSGGVRVVENLSGQINKDNKEQFGFRDGIAQPVIKGTGQTGAEQNMVELGEFILGYKNEYGVYPETPLLEEEQGDMHLFSDDEQGSGKKNIGRNGTYLVFRQMEQKVDTFWSYMNEQSKTEKGDIDVAASIKLASLMVGRWPSGNPLVNFPEHDPGTQSDLDNFGYAASDKEGLRCPFGSHVRRTNPRDTFEDNKAKLSTKLTNKHRILRRGRSYGEMIDTPGPTSHTPNGEVGLHFICLNANIENQFEFIQHTWSNSPKFQNLHNDPDPITGTVENRDGRVQQQFTIQDYPVNRTVCNIPQFTVVKGGAYFFLPSISALNYLGTI